MLRVSNTRILNKHYLYRIIYLLVVFFISACTTEKNTVVSRAYHNVTAHYNVYFNGKESLKAGIFKINNSVEDDYSKILPLYKSSNPSTANAAISDMDNSILKGSKLIQSHSITKKPKRRKNRSQAYIRFASREEFNNWIDDAYVLMGKAYFYKHNFASAVENFSHVVRKFGDDPSKYTASIWLIRCYTEMERYVEAYEIIQQMQIDENFPAKLEGELAAVIADYHARQSYYTDGIPFLQIAVKKTKTKDDRLRYKYVLAQWYHETGNTDKASATFREISRMNPPYKMAFNAQISAAGTFSGIGDPVKMKKELKRMLRDKKNREFRDQIYFAMGNISSKEGNMKLAKEEYTKSASLSSENLYQRALSCLTLAQIYFTELEYTKAQSYYDSAMVVIDEKYPDYQTISERHKSLTRLTDNIYTVQREDSLQRIAKMDETSRNNLIDTWIKLANEKEEKDRLAESGRMMDRNYFRMNESRFGLSQQQEGSGWYFYNPTTVAYGKVEFERLWGKRKLEDDWRRSDKRSGLDEGFAADEDSMMVEDKSAKKISDPKNREYYLQDLPLNDSLMQASHSKIRTALFNGGRIFKTDFSNFERAIESFVDLNKRYPENLYTLSSWFELWDLYTKQNNLEEALIYKNLIISKFPDSKYAKYLQNPNYFIELEAKADSINRMYTQAFNEFKIGKYSDAGKITNEIINMEPDSILVPKITFISNVASGLSTNRENFAKILTDYIKEYPEGEPTPLAERILKLIQESSLEDYQKLVDSGYLNDQIKNSELLIDKKGVDEFEGKFSYDEELLHYYVIVYPKNSGLDINRFKFDIANYNIDHYTKYDFDIEIQSLNSNNSMLIIRSLNDKEQGLIYFRSIIRKREVFESLKNIKYVNFIASSTNFREIVADKDYSEYLKFFIKNYSRFITSDFTDEILPEPEVLIAKAKEEELNLKERGSFVSVNPSGSGLDIFTDEVSAKQNFVIAVNAPKANFKPVIAAIDAYNREQYKQLGLTVRQSQIGGYQLLYVSHFKNKIEALGYFANTLANRKLFRSLDTLGYRNFIITDANLKKLTENQKFPEYLNFFKVKYIDNSINTTNTEVKVQNEGPYNANIEGKQNFVIIVPKDEINPDLLLKAINEFNNQKYKSASFVSSYTMLDDFRLIFKVEGLINAEQGIEYLRTIASEQKVYGILQEANFRNFVITPTNESIFKQSKNILIYMDFYKKFYLKQ